MKCERCGCSDTQENPVTLSIDPYVYEMEGDATEWWQCEDCREDSAASI